jgi:hypothetical protein
MYKKIIIFFILLILIAGSSFAIWKNKEKPNDEEKINSKLDSEMEYLNTSLISIANGLNNIVIQEYEITESSNNNTSSDSSNNTSKNDNSSKENSSNESNNETSKISFSMTQNTINTDEIDWKNLESEISNLYKSWSEIIIDLNKVNGNNENILKFSNDLDETTKYIKAQDKVNSLSMVAKLYSYLPQFMELYEKDGRKIAFMQTKTNIIRAYSIIEQEKWEEIKKEISSSINSFNTILNDVNNNKNQYNINKTYVLLNEFNNSIDTNDKEILYIKYRNLIQEIEYLNI